MRSHTLIFACLLLLLAWGCSGEKDQFSIAEGQVGPLTRDTPIRAVDSLFANDSIVVVNPVEGALATQGEVEIFDSEGSKLMVLTPKRDNDPDSPISDIRLVDNRYVTAQGIGPGSTFGELKKHYNVAAVDNAINAVVVFLKDSDIWITIDKKELPEDIRYNFSGPVEATQIPDAATFKYFRIGWDQPENE